MNREIKFRAWDDNKMIYPTNALSNRNRFFRLIREDAILMQYTGLKDKNGKEIYEGDIVCANGNKTILVKDNSDARRFVSPIFEDKYKSEIGRFNFKVYWQNSFSCFSFKSIEESVSINCEVNSRDYEIVGNIYENNELLKTEKL